MCYLHRPQALMIPPAADCRPLHIGGRLYSSDSLPSPGRLQGATAVGFAHSTDQFVCVVTGKVCHNKEGLYEVGRSRLHRPVHITLACNN